MPLFFFFPLNVAAIIILSFIAPKTCSAQFPKATQDNLTVVKSPLDPNITVTYKSPNGACTTAFNTQQQYTGWVNIPGTYPANMFFWFVGAREPTTALTLWLQGGPGSSSMFGFFTENGPCEVVEDSENQWTTVARTWGWDRASNMLFIDQPVQVGFSYDVPTNGSMDLSNGNMTAPAAPLPSNRPPGLFLNGTFSSPSANNTANTTETAAYAVWHMLQGFLGVFPQYNAPATTLAVNLFAESYGGKYGPVFADVWDRQNRIRKNSTMSNSTMDVQLASLGIVNGCVDDLIQAPYYPAMAVNNTYGLQSISSVRAALANASFYAPGGCQEAINQCRLATSYYDPNNTGSASGPNALCQTAYNTCTSNVMDAYGDSGRSFYDIAHQLPESFPPSTYIDYLNTQPILNAIGSVVNYTDFSNTVWSDLMSTGDWERGPIVPKLAALLGRGVRVGFMYGDRDYICNWLGGEAVSLNVAATEGGAYATNFPTAGYAPIIVNNSYIGGVVRQFGNLSFSRIYQAGHFVPAYQPETAFQVFARIVMGTSVSTGMAVNLSVYNTTGPLNATSSMSLPASPTATCYLRAIESSCSQDQIAAILRDEGVFINGVWYSASSDWPGATSTTSVSSQTATPTTSATTLTGLFTATSTPTNVAVVQTPRAETLGLCMILASWLMLA